MEKYRSIEKSIIKKFRKDIWSKFVKAIKDYELLSENDSVAVCISGRKDSFLLAKCMQELQRHGQFKFNLKFIVMNPGYNEENLKIINKNAKELNIPIEIFDAKIFDYVASLNTGSPCYICARMRRGHLYNKAKELGCNKIALGHHFNDIIETILMSILYGAEFKTIMPKLHSDNYEDVELIRPLYLVHEDAIKAWKNYNELNFINCACRFTENCSVNDEATGARATIKNLIKDLKTKNKYIEYNIFKASENVNLNTLISYKKDDELVHFLNDYDNKKSNK